MPEAPPVKTTYKVADKTYKVTDKRLAAAVVLLANGFSARETAALLHVCRSSLSRHLKQRAASAHKGATTTGNASSNTKTTSTTDAAVSETTATEAVITAPTVGSTLSVVPVDAAA